MEMTCPYGFGKTVELPYPEAVRKVRQLLQEQGFGILTEIDVKEKLREKIGVDFRPYIILGACNPKMAHRALQVEINLGLLLPCNVIVYETDDRRSAVMAMDPVSALQVVENPAMEEIARQVRDLLAKALDSL